jgi:hypothetical protein
MIVFVMILLLMFSSLDAVHPLRGEPKSLSLVRRRVRASSAVSRRCSGRYAIRIRIPRSSLVDDRLGSSHIFRPGALLARGCPATYK